MKRSFGPLSPIPDLQKRMWLLLLIHPFSAAMHFFHFQTILKEIIDSASKTLPGNVSRLLISCCIKPFFLLLPLLLLQIILNLCPLNLDPSTNGKTFFECQGLLGVILNFLPLIHYCTETPLW